MSVSSDAYSFAAGYLGCCDSRFDLDSFSDAIAVDAQIDAKSLTQPAGSAGELSYIVGSAPPAHLIKTFDRLGCANQHRSSSAAVSSEVQTVIHTVDKVDIDMAKCLPHHSRLFWSHY